VKRLTCLDGLRGALALYVLLAHMAPFADLPAWITSVLSHGEAGVDLFFTLSGLLIVQSLEHYDYHARPFLIARVARTYPVFLPVFVLAIAVQPLAMDFAAMPWIGPHSAARTIWSDGWPASWAVVIASHLTMTHGMVPNGVLPDLWVSFLGAAWSLSTEWQFYALVAVIGARFGRGGRGQQGLVALLLGLALASVAWQAMVPLSWQFSRAFLPNKAMYFALGVASATLLAERCAWLYFVGVLGAVMLLCVLHDNALKLAAPLAWVVCLAAQSVESGGMPGRAAAWFGLRMLGVMLSSRLLCWFGAVSYSLYLVHEPIQKLLGVLLADMAGGRPLLFTLFWLPSTTLLPIWAASWLHHQIEVPALRRGKVLAAAAWVSPVRA
jgi:peptidoglycan/LPS O-acetylase OafA/YrhL